MWSVADTAIEAQLSAFNIPLMDFNRIMNYCISLMKRLSPYPSGNMDLGAILSDDDLAPIRAVIVSSFVIGLTLVILALAVVFIYRKVYVRGKGFRFVHNRLPIREILVLGPALFFVLILVSGGLVLFGVYLSSVLPADLRLTNSTAGSAFTAADRFLEGFRVGINESPEIVDVSLRSVIKNLTAAEVTPVFKRAFGHIVPAFTRNLRRLNESLAGLQTSLEGFLEQSKQLGDKIAAVKSELSAVNDEMISLTRLKIGGKEYFLQGFSGVDRIAELLPGRDFYEPRLTELISSLNKLPNFNHVALVADDTYLKITQEMDQMITNIIPPSATIAQGFLNTLNLRIDNAQEKVKDAGTASSTLLGIIIKSDMLRNSLQMTQLFITLIALIVGSHAFYRQSTSLGWLFFWVLLAFLALYWLEYAVYYTASAPLAVICNSRDHAMYSDYMIEEYQVQPGFLVEQCRDDVNLFKARIHPRGEKVAYLVTKFAMDKATMLENFINQNAVNNSINMDKLEKELDILRNTSFNLGKLAEVPTWNMMEARRRLVNVSLAWVERRSLLSPENLDSELGSDLKFHALLDKFNEIVETVTGVGTWSEQEIIEHYVKPNKTFKGSDATKRYWIKENKELETIWYSEGLYERTEFRYYANEALKDFKQKLMPLQIRLDRVLDNEAANQLERLINHLITNAQDSIRNVGVVLSESANIFLNFGHMVAGCMNFIEAIINIIGRNVRPAVQFIIDQVMLSHPNLAFGKCSKLAETLDNFQHAACDDLLSDVSALWFSLMLLSALVSVLVLMWLCYVPFIETLKIYRNDQIYSPVADSNIECESDSETLSFVTCDEEI